ncbi:hypothetical protein PFISCL1PPCAC_115, partial [Pristionchus fissidentatus]
NIPIESRRSKRLLIHLILNVIEHCLLLHRRHISSDIESEVFNDRTRSLVDACHRNEIFATERVTIDADDDAIFVGADIIGLDWSILARVEILHL